MSATESIQGARRYMMMAVIGIGGGLALMAAMLYIGALVNGSESLRTQLAHGLADQYVRSIDQSFKSAQDQIDSLATTPGLAQALNKGQTQQLEAMARLMERGIPAAARLRLLPTAELNLERTDHKDLSFADLDMIGQARDGLSVPGELRLGGDEMQLHLIRAVHDGPGGPIRGVVLLSLQSSVITGPLEAFPGGAETQRGLERIDTKSRLRVVDPASALASQPVNDQRCNDRGFDALRH